MADNSALLKVGLFAGAGYLAYKFGYLNFLFPATAAAPAPGSTGSPASTTSGPVSPTPPAAAPSASVLDGIFQRITAAAGSGAKLDADNWGWYLNAELATLGKGAAPDPVPLFGARPFPAMTAAEWWGPMSGALRSQMGLSGLGYFGGLAAVTHRYARRGR